jgi:hypothetical protein
VSRRVVLITCSTPDALPFLRSLAASQEEATIVALASVVAAAEREGLGAERLTMGGLSSLEGLREAAKAAEEVTIVVAPDPWGPLNGKGFVRARLLAPWVLASDDHVDLLELLTGGRSGQLGHRLSRGWLIRRLYVHEILATALFILSVGAGRPPGPPEPPASVLLAVARLLAAPVVVVTTIARLIPFVLWTEARARFFPPHRNQ